MWMGIGVFVFIFLVGKMTQWRVHSQVCDTHLAILPMPDEGSVESNLFRHGGALFKVNAMISFLFFWRRGAKADDDASSLERRMTAGPVPVEEPPLFVTRLRAWAAETASTFRVAAFGRRIVVTSAPKLARRVLHTHFKLYSKDPKNDPNTQIPPSLHWFVPNSERALMTRPDMKDRAPHGAARTGFAQALLRAIYNGPALRAVVQDYVKRFVPATGELSRMDVKKLSVAAVLRTLCGDAAVDAVFPTAEASGEFMALVMQVAAELAREREEPWRWYILRASPGWRKIRARLVAQASAVGEKAFAAAVDAVKAKSDPDGIAPLALLLRGQLPPDVAGLDAKAFAAVKAAMVDVAAGELITALTMAAGPVATGVAWALHYCALPQNHTLVKTIREEATVRPPAPEADAAALAPDALPGAVEAVREVLRLHPPIPVVTRTAVNDDLVAVTDIDVAPAKLNHKIAAQMDGTGRGSFTQRSGCVMLPSSVVVAVNLDELLKRPDVFGPDAADFNPRRFLAHRASTRSVADGAAAGGNQAADPSTWFLAGGFGIGARGCPAAHWALAVMAEMVRGIVSTRNMAHPAGKDRRPGRWHLRVAERKE